MSKKILLIIIISAVILPACAFADIRNDISMASKPSEGEGMRVDTMNKNQEIIMGEIGKHESISLSQYEVSGLSRNEDGTLKSVAYSDGTVATYSDYTFNEKGNADSLTITVRQFSIRFISDKSISEAYVEPSGRGSSNQLAATGAPPVTRYAQALSATPPNGISSTGTPPDKGTGGEPNNPDPIIVHVPDFDGKGLDDIAKNPLPRKVFENITKALDDLDAIRESAAVDYTKKTEPYYTGIEEKLKAAEAALASEGVYVYEFLERSNAASAPEEKRKILQEAVEHIYVAAQTGEPGGAAGEFLVTERDLRDTVIVPEMQIYEDKVRAAMKYLYYVIDELMGADMALYMNADKERIDVLINLPEIKKATPEAPKSEKK